MENAQNAQNAQNAGTTNNTPDSLVQIIATAENTTWVRPADNAEFKINADATLPDIVFEFATPAAGPYAWSWKITWDARMGVYENRRGSKVKRNFTESGTFSSADKIWKANFGEGKVLGGNLSVSVKIGEITISRNIKISGQNPTEADVASYMATLEGGENLLKLARHETHIKHFINSDGQPILSFDNGYGMTQATNPPPDYNTVWNWKANVNAGRDLFQQKLNDARRYLSQHGNFTEEMVERDAIAMWNGGHYYKWDSTKNSWVRKYNHLCDSTTGNIGWNMNRPENAGQTEQQLHVRDQPTYRLGGNGQSAEHPWVYSGLCYADTVYERY
ncbi:MULTISPECIES: hypothetical protein [Tenebrionibacter/Tenebrionicola group]|jgi:hypothetical protein|uniref:Uncharacterized protein n=2 Tax=Tenebrionibacter/Tenebrionicola group TaxID=2969848 RepID=A0A8K0V4L1_9ENTR|nr:MULTISPECIES: hypothetical protein [Tenebrionibacter/Tenebrionicola group]MBK4716681.1 hypothetical protein [Tenebrionibacter intestinalis]MBV5097371.1 hypothetical protein [Tenebrionicola larvae]